MLHTTRATQSNIKKTIFGPIALKISATLIGHEDHPIYPPHSHFVISQRKDVSEYVSDDSTGIPFS